MKYSWLGSFQNTLRWKAVGQYPKLVRLEVRDVPIDLFPAACVIHQFSRSPSASLFESFDEVVIQSLPVVRYLLGHFGLNVFGGLSTSSSYFHRQVDLLAMVD